MAKVTDYSFRGMPKPVQNFKDEVYTILNYGKVGFPVISAVPGWRTYEGELALFVNTAASPSYRIYARLTSAWVMFAGVFGADGSGGLPDPPTNSIQYNSGGQFGGDQELLWDSTGRTMRIAPASSGAVTPLFLSNTNAAVGGTTRAIHIPFGFGTTTDAGLIRLTSRSSNDAGGNANSSFLSFHVKTDGSLAELVRIGRIVGVGGGVGIKWTDPQHPLSVGGSTIIGAGYDPNTGTDTPSIPSNGVAVEGSIVIGGDSNHASLATRGLTIRADGDVVGGNQKAEVYLVGADAHDTPGIIFFGDTGDPDRGRVEMAVAGGAPNQNYLQVSYSSNQSGGFVNLTDIGSPVVTAEDPVLDIGGVFGEAAIIRFQSSMTVAKQRCVSIQAFSVKSVGATTTTVREVATLYIQGACALGDSLRVSTGNYALWIDDGPVRIDGSLVLGGATTEAKASGIIFTTTATSVAQNTTAETTLITGAVGTTSLAANTLSDGRTIRLNAGGFWSTSNGAVTLRMRAKLGGTTILDTGAQTPTVSISSGGWGLEGFITCLTTGGAGSVQGNGRFFGGYSATSAGTWHMANTAAITLNTTAANVLEVTAQWGGPGATNQLHMTNCVAELLN